MSRAVPIIMLRVPGISRLMRAATRPMVRFSTPARMSSARAAKTASDGTDWPSQSSIAAAVLGRYSDTSGFITERAIICTIGTAKVTSRNSNSGSTSMKARRRARDSARRRETCSGLPSAVVRSGASGAASLRGGRGVLAPAARVSLLMLERGSAAAQGAHDRSCAPRFRLPYWASQALKRSSRESP